MRSCTTGALWDAAFDQGLVSLADDGSRLPPPLVRRPCTACSRRVVEVDDSALGSLRILLCCAVEPQTGRLKTVGARSTHGWDGF